MRLNALVRKRAGARRTFVLEPDFEGAVGFGGRGPKPARAWKRLEHARRDELPEPLVRAVQLALKVSPPWPAVIQLTAQRRLRTDHGRGGTRPRALDERERRAPSGPAPEARRALPP